MGVGEAIGSPGSSQTYDYAFQRLRILTKLPPVAKYVDSSYGNRCGRMYIPKTTAAVCKHIMCPICQQKIVLEEVYSLI